MLTRAGSEKVKIRSIASAIKVIIEKLTDFQVERLPSYGAINHLMYEAQFMVLYKADRAMLSEKDGKSTTNILMNDGTRKQIQDNFYQHH